MKGIRAPHFVKQDTVFVRNNGNSAFKGDMARYDGESFTIEPGEYLEMPPECARLCFGWGEADKHRVIRRNGWAKTEGDMPAALALLDTFSFHSTEEEAQDRSIAPAIGGAAEEAKASPADTVPLKDGPSNRIGGVNLLEKALRPARPSAPA